MSSMEEKQLYVIYCAIGNFYMNYRGEEEYNFENATIFNDLAEAHKFLRDNCYKISGIYKMNVVDMKKLAEIKKRFNYD